MNDKLIMTEYLLLLKSTVEVYIHGTIESSNKKIRDTLESGLSEILEQQKNTYNKMTENCWYEVNNISPSLVKQTLIKIENN